FLSLPREAVAVLFRQQALADPVSDRRDLEQLVVGQEFDRVVEREILQAIELRGDIGGAAAHVREVLPTHDVHFQIARADVLADDHTLVNLDSGTDEQLAALLGLVETEGGRRTGLVRDQRPQIARLDWTCEGPVTREERVHHALSARVRQERLAESEQAARRDLVNAVRASVVAVFHVDECATTPTRELHDGAEHVLRDLDLELFERLELLATLVLVDDLRTRDLKLVPLAAQ